MKTAVITGAGSGIGQAIAYNLSAAGNHIVILDRSEEAGEATAAQIKSDGGSAEVIACDVSSVESVKAAFDKIKEVHILVNNAGIASIGNVQDCEPEELDRVYNVNVKGVSKNAGRRRWLDR